MAIRTVHVAVYDTWADWEAGHLTARINNPMWQRDPGSIRVQTVGSAAGEGPAGGPKPVTTMGGLRVLPDLAAEGLDPADSAMLVLPGADLWESDQGIPWAADLAKRFVAAGVPVAAICGGTLGLARAGLLDGRKHTSSAAEYLAGTGYAGGELYLDRPAVTDRGVITAGPLDPIPFAREVLAELDIYEPAMLNAWYLLFNEHDPSGLAGLSAGAPA